MGLVRESRARVGPMHCDHLGSSPDLCHGHVLARVANGPHADLAELCVAVGVPPPPSPDGPPPAGPPAPGVVFQFPV